MAQLALTQHQASCCPSVHCVQVAAAMWADTESPARQEGEPREQERELCSGACASHIFLCLQWPTLANDLFPNVTDGKIPFPFHSDATGHAYNICLPFAPSMLTNNQVMTMAPEQWPLSGRGPCSGLLLASSNHLLTLTQVLSS